MVTDVILEAVQAVLRENGIRFVESARMAPYNSGWLTRRSGDLIFAKIVFSDRDIVITPAGRMFATTKVTVADEYVISLSDPEMNEKLAGIAELIWLT